MPEAGQMGVLGGLSSLVGMLDVLRGDGVSGKAGQGGGQQVRGR